MKKLVLAAFLVALAIGPQSVAQGPQALSLIDPGTGAAIQVPLTGAVTHVIFFATWCPTCVEELDALSVMVARYDSNAYRQVVVAVENRQDAEKLSRFMASKKPGVVLLFDSSGEVQRRLGADRLPQHILFDSNGNEIHRSSLLDDDLRKQITDRVGNSRRPRGR